MAIVVPVTVNYEINQPSEGQYEVKQVAPEEPAQLNSGNRIEFSFDVKIFSVCVTTVKPRRLTAC